jgi:hypothetical protein
MRTPKRLPVPAAIAIGISLAVAAIATPPVIAHSNHQSEIQAAQDVAQAKKDRAHERAVELKAARAAQAKADKHERLIVELDKTILESESTIAAVTGKVDAAGLVAASTPLYHVTLLKSEKISDLIVEAGQEVARVSAAAAEIDRTAAEKAAAELAAAQAAQAAEAARNANTPGGAKATARDLSASTYGWGEDQFTCLNKLWQKESEWKVDAYNRNGGATGIPQSLPGSKMATFGADWQTNATTQIRWGLDYIKRSYGSPCSAWNHSVQVNWY